MKNAKRILSVLLSVLMLLSAFAVAANAEDGESNWVQIKTSSDELAKGDLYVDLDSFKEASIEMFLYQNLCNYVTPKDPNWSPSDPPRFNNLSVVACEKLAALYPELWSEALQEAYEADPSWGMTGFYTIQDAWSILFRKVMAAHPELGFTDWYDLSSYGIAYIQEEYPESYAQAAADAAAEFATYENATWYYDANFSSTWSWLKAEIDGEKLIGIPKEIEETFSEYGIEWQPVAASAAAAADGGYFLNGTTIAPKADGEALEYFDTQRTRMFNLITRDSSSFPPTQKSYPITYTTQEDETIVFDNEEQVWTYVNAQVDQLIEDYEARMTDYYTHYFDDATIFVNPDDSSLFQIKMTKTVTEYGATYEMTNNWPLNEQSYSEMPISATDIWPCISTLNWTWTDENTASVAIAPVKGVGVVYLDATVTAEETTAPQVGVEGVKTATATADYNGVTITATKTFPIPALEPEETPITPETPETPDTPSDGGKKIAGDFLSKLFAWLTELFEMFTRWITAA